MVQGQGLKKYLKWTVIAFCIWFVINRPDAAAIVVQNGASVLGHAAGSVATFAEAVLPK